MKPTILAIRSIGAEFASRIYNPILIIFLCITVVLIGVSLWLTTLSGWWWLLFVIVMLWAIIGGVLLIVAKVIIAGVTPQQSKDQAGKTRALVDRLQRVTEVTQTPKFVLLFYIVRDIAAKKTNGFISSTITDTSSLKDDFINLSNSFR